MMTEADFVTLIADGDFAAAARWIGAARHVDEAERRYVAVRDHVHDVAAKKSEDNA